MPEETTPSTSSPQATRAALVASAITSPVAGSTNGKPRIWEPRSLSWLTQPPAFSPTAWPNRTIPGISTAIISTATTRAVR